MRMVKASIGIFVFCLGATLALGSPSTQRDFAVSKADSVQSRPTVAYDANHDRFLVTWTDARNHPGNSVDIYGRIIDARGTPVTGDFPIARNKGGQGTSSVAFDPLNNRYLVAWADWRDALSIDSDIYGRLVNADGTMHGKEFVIANRRVSQKQPAVAFDPARRRFLVVWKDDRGKGAEQLYGRFIDTRGRLLAEEFKVAEGAGRQDRPSLHYDPKRKRFMVVWRDIVDEHQYLNTPLNGKGIFAALIDPDSGPRGPGNLIDTEEDACLPPSLYAAAYAPGEDLFLVVWTTARQYLKTAPDGKRTMGLDVHGAFVRADNGKRQGRAFPIAVGADYQEFPSVVYDPNKDRFLVIWYDLRRDPSARNQDVYGRYITPKGKRLEEFLISDSKMPGIRRYPAVAFSPKSNTWLVLWEDSRHKTSTTHSQRIYGRVR